jgi:protein-tyrosine phosphatase
MMAAQRPIRVLFVCMGNICRSPMAEAVFRHEVTVAGLADQFVIDSAGTGGWHAGERPHRGTLAILAQHNIEPGDQRARRLEIDDFALFHYIVAMDHENLSDMAAFSREARSRVRLLLDYAPNLGTREVPDPFYTGGFEHVYKLVTAGCRGLLAHICEREGI